MEPTSRPLIAAAWMSGAILSFTSMAVAGRAIAVEMNTFELMMYRSIIGFAIIATVVAFSSRGFAQVATSHVRLHVLRNLFHFTGQNLWFFGIVAIPLSQLVALEFTNPIWVALLAPLMLGEKMTRTRVVAALLGFIGVLIVAQPGVSPIEVGHLAGLAAALGFALNTIYTKQISRFDSVLCVLFWMTLSQSLMGLVLSLPGGIPVPSVAVLPWLAVVGAAGITAHFCLTSALRHAPATIVAPMEFFRLPLIALVGVALYDEPLMIAVFVGAGFIIAGNLLNVYREQTRKRQNVFA